MNIFEMIGYTYAAAVAHRRTTALIGVGVQVLGFIITALGTSAPVQVVGLVVIALGTVLVLPIVLGGPEIREREVTRVIKEGINPHELMGIVPGVVNPALERIASVGGSTVEFSPVKKHNGVQTLELYTQIGKERVLVGTLIYSRRTSRYDWKFERIYVIKQPQKQQQQPKSDKQPKSRGDVLGKYIPHPENPKLYWVPTAGDGSGGYLTKEQIFANPMYH